MKILFIADICHPGTQGGIQTFGRTLKKIFKNQLIFISYKEKKEKIIYKVEDNIEIKKMNFLLKLLNKLFFNKIREIYLEKKIKKINPNICILSSPQNLKFLKNIECKKILVQHTQLDRYFKNKYYYSNDKSLFEISKRYLDYFIVTSPKDKIKWFKDYDFPESKIKLIRHSCTLKLLENKKIKNKILIMIARIDNKIKRFDLPIQAMKQLPDYKLKIYGEGLDKEKLEQLITVKGIKNVKFYGSTNKIEEKLDEAGIFIITSDVEGYPISAIEAMRRGLPLIVRNTFEGASDIVINNGILLDKKWDENSFCNGIKSIYSNYEFYSNNSIEMGKRHNLDKIEEEWRNLINDASKKL